VKSCPCRPLLWGRPLRVHDAAPGSHPVDRAGPDDLGGAQAVPVEYRALEQVGYGGYPDMRMGTHVHPVARREVRRTDVIEEDKWPDHLALGGGQHAPDLEPAQVFHLRPNHHLTIPGRRLAAGRRTLLPAHRCGPSSSGARPGQPGSLHPPALGSIEIQSGPPGTMAKGLMCP
jgi:hypothetical protein